jgi:hypothetical protein
MPKPNNSTLAGRPVGKRTPKSLMKTVTGLSCLQKSLYSDPRISIHEFKEASRAIETLIQILCRLANVTAVRFSYLAKTQGPGRHVNQRTPKSFLQMIAALARLRQALIADSTYVKTLVKKACYHIDALTAILGQLSDNMSMSKEDKEREEERSKTAAEGHVTRKNYKSHDAA